MSRLIKRRNTGAFYMIWIGLLLLALCLPPATARAEAGAILEITEWEVPFEAGRLRDPSVAPDGAVWFVGQQNHYLARFDPATGAFKKRQLDDDADPII